MINTENFYLNFKSDFPDGKPLVKSVEDIFTYHDMMPDAGYHALSLFPNNYILYNHEKHLGNVESLIKNFSDIIHSKRSTERDILNFIKEKEAYFILEGVFNFYNFGHHDAYLFREFQLSVNYKVDFLLVGKSSGGYEFVFIEFESQSGNITMEDGSFGECFRKGINQVKDWDNWIDSNFYSLKENFKKYKNSKKQLPLEFYELDKSRIHYLVVAGTREDFKEKTYRLTRKKENNITIKHYDNLIDATIMQLNFKLNKKE